MPATPEEIEGRTSEAVPGGAGGVSVFENEPPGYGFNDSFIEEFTQSADAFWTRTTTGVGSTASWVTASSTTYPWAYLTETLAAGTGAVERICLVKPVQVLKSSRLRFAFMFRLRGSVSTPAFFIGMFEHSTTLGTTRNNGTYLYKASGGVATSCRTIKGGAGETSTAGLSLPSTVGVWHLLQIEIATQADSGTARIDYYLNGVPMAVIETSSEFPDGTWLYPAFGLSSSTGGEILDVAYFGRALSSIQSSDS